MKLIADINLITGINNTLSTSGMLFQNIAENLLYLFQIFSLIILIYLLVLIGLWIFGWSGRGIVIFPFDNTTGDEKYNGKTISDLLVSEFQRIKEAHSNKPIGPNPSRVMEARGDVVAENMKNVPLMVSESITRNISYIGSIETKGLSISIGHLLITLRRLCPFGNAGIVINGSLQKHRSFFYLVAHLEGNTYSKAWTVKCKTRDSIPFLVKSLAFLISKDLLPDCQARTVDGFRYFTYALEKRNSYKKTRLDKDLEKAYSFCLRATEHELDYYPLFSLCYDIGRDFLDLGDFEKAETILEKATFFRDRIEPSSFLPYFKDLYPGYEFISEDSTIPRQALNWQFARTYNLLGVTLENQKSYDEAFKNYIISRDVAEMQYWAPCYNLGRLASKLDKDEKEIIEDSYLLCSTE